MLDFSNFEYHPDKLPKDIAERNLFLKDLVNRFFNEAKSTRIFDEYLLKYEPKWVEYFVMNYAEVKMSLVKFYELYADDMQKRESIEFRDEAEKLLGLIMQKKLFNLQLQWRAGQIDINGIRNSFDFHFWCNYIHYCPFVPTVTEEEVGFMQSFLRTHNYTDFETWDQSWQFYINLMIKDEDGNYGNMPDWYEYYDLMTGSSALLLLPDIKGKKEKYYMDIAHEAEVEEYKAKNAQNPVSANVSRPTLFAFPKDIVRFAEACENDPYFLELFREWGKGYEKRGSGDEYLNERSQWATDILKEADREVIIQRGIEWRQAIIQCAERYITDRALEVLDTVYDEYRARIDVGVVKRFSQDELEDAYQKSMAKHFSEMILKGRELCGEPRDFNIY